MLRRNIDITLGLVNGAIGIVTSIFPSCDNNDSDMVKIVLATGLGFKIERVSVKFKIMDRVYVMRKYIPHCLIYGITIHKSQKLSLKMQ